MTEIELAWIKAKDEGRTTHICGVDGCNRKHYARGFCQKHYETMAVGTRKTCSVEGCEIKIKGLGLCRMHWDRFKKHGDTGPTERLTPAKGEGRGSVDSHGYVIVSVNGKHKKQHTLVMESLLGRALFPHESVHHLNGQRADNRPENLELWSHSQPEGQRINDKVKWAIDLLTLYAPDRLCDV